MRPRFLRRVTAKRRLAKKIFSLLLKKLCLDPNEKVRSIQSRKKKLPRIMRQDTLLFLRLFLIQLLCKKSLLFLGDGQADIRSSFPQKTATFIQENILLMSWQYFWEDTRPSNITLRR